MYREYYESAAGLLKIEADDKGITSLSFCKEREETESGHTLISQAVRELEEYFDGTRKTFTLPLNPKGTDFQQKVWNQLQKIQYGETTTYQSQATILGDVKAIRAVASANGQNPIAIIIPCHRVIGTDGSLTGYAGGLDKKEWLLVHEGAIASQLSIF